MAAAAPAVDAAAIESGLAATRERLAGLEEQRTREREQLEAELRGARERLEVLEGSERDQLDTALAEARISYDGLGVVDDKQRPGILARVFDWVYPF